MAKKKKTTRQKAESDSTFFLKIVLFFILGTIWVRLPNAGTGVLEYASLPLGFIVGLVFAAHEHFRIDRKLEFAILLAAAFISFPLPVGIMI